MLGSLFDQVHFLYAEPLTIAQISFSKKTQIENHILCVGDAAGMITPLCGNGMSMALHGAKIASEMIVLFLNNKISRREMERKYQKNWNKEFAQRLRTGRFLQSFFGSAFWSGFLIRIVRPFPLIMQRLIKQTHGSSF